MPIRKSKEELRSKLEDIQKQHLELFGYELSSEELREWAEKEVKRLREAFFRNRLDYLKPYDLLSFISQPEPNLEAPPLVLAVSPEALEFSKKSVEEIEKLLEVPKKRGRPAKQTP